MSGYGASIIVIGVNRGGGGGGGRPLGRPLF